MPPKKKKPMKQQHKQFCMLIAGGTMSNTVAYMETHPGLTQETARVGASRLLTNDNVIEEVNRLRQLTEQGDVMSRQFKREELKRDVKDKDIDFKDKHRAMELDSKMAGHYEPDEVNHNITIKWGDGECR